MLGQVLEHGIAAGKKARGRGFTAPDGTFYKWNKSTDPTQADIDAIVQFHEQSKALETEARQGMARGRKATSESLRKQEEEKKLDDMGRMGLASGRLATVARRKVEQKSGEPFEATIQKVVKADPRRFGTGKPRESDVEDLRHEFEAQVLDTREPFRALNETAAEFGGVVSEISRPVLGKVGRALGYISPFNLPLQGMGVDLPKVYENALPAMAGGIAAAPLNVGAEVAGLLDPNRTPLQKLGGTANIVTQAFPVATAKAAIGGIKGGAKLWSDLKGLSAAEFMDEALKNAEGSGLASGSKKVVESPDFPHGAPDNLGATFRPRAGVDDFVDQNWKQRTEGVINALTQEIDKAGSSKGQRMKKAKMSKLRAELRNSLDAGQPHAAIREELTDMWNARSQVSPPKPQAAAPIVTEPPPAKAPAPKKRQGGKGAPIPDPEPTQPPIVQTPATGISMAARNADAEQLGTNRAAPTQGASNSDAFASAQKRVAEGEDPDAILANLATQKRPATQDEIAGFAVRRGQYISELNRLKNGLDAGDEALRPQYTELLEKIGKFDADLDIVKGEGGRSLNALKIGSTIDEGDYAQVVAEIQRRGGNVSGRAEAKIRNQTEALKAKDAEIAKLKKEIAEAAAKKEAAPATSKGPRFSREELDAELDDLFQQFSQATSKLSAGLDPEILPIVGKIALNYAKRGVLKWDDLVASVRKHIPDATDDEIADGIAAVSKGKRAEQSAIQKEINRLKNRARYDVKVRAQIAELQRQLDTRPIAPIRKGKADLGTRLGNLQAERDLLAQEIRGRLESAVPPTDNLFVRAVNAPKSLKSSMDISAPGRQGWLLGLANPDKIPVAFWDQLKALVNPKKALQIQNAILKRENASLYRRGKLHLSTLDGTGFHGEEAFAARLFPQWRKFNPFRASERAYNAYLNRIRADVFDRMVKWHGGDLTDEQLEIIGNYINVASGRGGKSIPGFDKAAEALNNAFFSPRYAASRFEYLAGQPIFKSTKGGMRVTAKARMLVARQYAQMLGALGGVYALAKGAGAEINKDRASSDFGKIRLGNTRIDPLAGLQQAIVAGHRLLAGEYTTSTGKKSDLNNPEYGGMDRGEVAWRFVRSKFSPTAGAVWSLLDGKDYIGQEYDWKNAARDLTLPISMQDLVEGSLEDGWNKDDFLGLLNFLGFNTSTYDSSKRPEKKGDPRS